MLVLTNTDPTQFFVAYMMGARFDIAWDELVQTGFTPQKPRREL